MSDLHPISSNIQSEQSFSSDTITSHVPCVEFKAEPGTETREVSDGLNVDLDAVGNLLGFDIDHASKRLDLSALETESLPVGSIRVC